MRSADEEPVAVVQGLAPDTGWRELSEAAVAVRAGALWVAGNTDATYPSSRGPLPGNGALVAALAAATGRSPVVVGKPEPELHRESVERVGAQQPLVVGDRLDTDVLGAVRGGVGQPAGPHRRDRPRRSCSPRPGGAGRRTSRRDLRGLLRAAASRPGRRGRRRTCGSARARVERRRRRRRAGGRGRGRGRRRAARLLRARLGPRRRVGWQPRGALRAACAAAAGPSGRPAPAAAEAQAAAAREAALGERDQVVAAAR